MLMSEVPLYIDREKFPEKPLRAPSALCLGYAPRVVVIYWYAW